VEEHSLVGEYCPHDGAKLEVVKTRFQKVKNAIFLSDEYETLTRKRCNRCGSEWYEEEKD